MEGIVGAFIFLIFLVGFMRVDANVTKIRQILERMEETNNQRGGKK